jgi:hypothetical protein
MSAAHDTARRNVQVVERALAQVLDDKTVARDVLHERLGQLYQSLPICNRGLMVEAMMLRLCGLTLRDDVVRAKL